MSFVVNLLALIPAASGGYLLGLKWYQSVGLWCLMMSHAILTRGKFQ